MHRITACIAASAFLAAANLAAAQSGGHGDMKGMDMKGMDMKGMDMKRDSGKSQAHQAFGTVNKVDKDKGTVTIAHGAVPTLKWPAMTMTFKATDKKMLDQLKPGAKVDFDFVQRGKDYVITQMK